MTESGANSSWMPSMWSAIEATNTEHDTKRKEKAAKKALVILLDQSDQTNEVNLMPSLLKDTLSSLNQEQEQLKISRAKKKENKKKEQEKEQQLDVGSGGISALIDMYSSMSDHGLSTSGSFSGGSSSIYTSARTPGLPFSKAGDASSISSGASYVTEFDREHKNNEVTTSSTVTFAQPPGAEPPGAASLSPTSTITAARSSPTVTFAQPSGAAPLSPSSSITAARSSPSLSPTSSITAASTNAGTSHPTLPNAASAALFTPTTATATTSSPTVSKEAIVLKMAQIKRHKKQKEDAYMQASRTVLATQPELNLQLAALYQQKSRKLIVEELALLRTLQALKQREQQIAATANPIPATAPNTPFALQLSNKSRQEQHLQLLQQQQQEQQEQVASLDQLLLKGGIAANANAMASAAALSRPSKRQRLATTQQMAKQAFFNNCPSMSEQAQNIMEYTLPLTLPLMFKLGYFTTFAQLWCIVIVVGHTTETVFTNFGPDTKKFRISDETAPITPLLHHLMDCGWLHSFITTMLLRPLWFSPDSTLAFWMAMALVQTLPIYLAVSFKSHYVIGKSNGEIDQTKSQLVELRLIDCFTCYESSACYFVLYRKADMLSWLGNGKLFLYLGILAFNIAPLYLSWAYSKHYEQAKMDNTITISSKGAKRTVHKETRRQQRLPASTEEEEEERVGCTKDEKVAERPTKVIAKAKQTKNNVMEEQEVDSDGTKEVMIESLSKPATTQTTKTEPERNNIMAETEEDSDCAKQEFFNLPTTNAMQNKRNQETPSPLLMVKENKKKKTLL